MELFDLIFEQSELISKPPVLIDIGASSQIVEEWRSFAKYSICIAFDPDTREMQFIEKESDYYKKLIVYNCVVTDSNLSSVDFYLTKSPYCSSSLVPNNQNLSNWSFWELFEIEKKVLLNARNLKDVLEEQNLSYIDWFKTDSQGTDLKLFKSLDENIINKIIVADFEPGFLDAYINEDKFYGVLSHLDNLPFWLSDFKVKGSQRLNKSLISSYFKYNKKLNIKESPGWAEISYFNNFKNLDNLGKRELLLGCAFALAKKQNGFALELSEIGKQKFGNDIFSVIFDFVYKDISSIPNPKKKTILKNKIKKKLIRIIENL